MKTEVTVKLYDELPQVIWQVVQGSDEEVIFSSVNRNTCINWILGEEYDEEKQYTIRAKKVEKARLLISFDVCNFIEKLRKYKIDDRHRMSALLGAAYGLTLKEADKLLREYWEDA
jgi:hypothetical protein